MVNKSILKIFLSRRIMVEHVFFDGAILVGDDGKIAEVVTREKVYLTTFPITQQVFDVGNNIIMPGLIDSHVHVNEPGRTDWEGFETATRAAAAGGITTIIDMPLNSKPPTTDVKNFKEKIVAAKGKCYVDVGFWGGLVGNNLDDLRELQEAGVVGFKCFMCNSGVDEFPSACLEDVQAAVDKLKDRKTVLAFHAEIDCGDHCSVTENPTLYQTFLKSRPDSMELNAIREILTLDLKDSKTLKLHIVHLSTAQAVPLLNKAKQAGKNISVETCHHYLGLSSEEVPKGATQFKCTPPIRDSRNRAALWKALQEGNIDLVVSDHSPCTPDLKDLETGNFLKAWGGISSVQFGLSLFWTQLYERCMDIFLINEFLSRGPARLVGLNDCKGEIKAGYDADFVIWNEEGIVTINESMIQHKNKLTPYLGKQVRGEVIMTVLGGEIVYDNGKFCDAPHGKLLINEKYL